MQFSENVLLTVHCAVYGDDPAGSKHVGVCYN
jgi:hypothetical protein